MIGSVTDTQTFDSGITEAASATMGKDEFLQLLVAQLQQQDPMNPQDGAEFVAQLAQFTSVEQLMNIGSGMDTLAMAQQASTSAQVVDFIGRDVISLADASGASVSLDDPPAVSFSLEEDTKNVTVEIVDSSGNTVRSIEAGDLDSGSQDIAFDGRDSSGALLDKDADYSARVMGREEVVGVTYENGYPELLLESGNRVTMADIVRVEDDDTPDSAGGSTVTADDIVPASALGSLVEQSSPLPSLGQTEATTSVTPNPAADPSEQPALSEYIQRVLDEL